MSRTAEFKEICNNISLNTTEEIYNQQGKYNVLNIFGLAEPEDFLGKKTNRENEFLNIYQELHEDEALEISKALSKQTHYNILIINK
jgi:hypothetical protein